jgi:hypothetical protein
MLTIEEKKSIFEKSLCEKNQGYGSQVREEIHYYFFQLENFNFEFLNELNTEIEIKQKVEFIVSKIIMHEHEEGINTIIESYI